MQRRSILAAVGIAIGASLLGVSSSVRSLLGIADAENDDPSGESTGAGTLQGGADGSQTGIGSYSLTVFHKDDLSPEEATPSIDSTDTVLDHEIYQEAFDLAVESGRGAYSTNDEDEAETLASVYEEIPENDDDVLCRYVIHEGEVLCVRFMQLH